MAKLTARGARVVARYRARDGWRFAVRSDGAVLSKMPLKGAGWKLYLRFSPEDAARYAANRADLDG